MTAVELFYVLSDFPRNVSSALDMRTMWRARVDRERGGEAEDAR